MLLLQWHTLNLVMFLSGISISVHHLTLAVVEIKHSKYGLCSLLGLGALRSGGVG